MQWTPEKGVEFFTGLIEDRIEKLNKPCDEEWVAIHTARIEVLTRLRDKCEARIK